MNKQQFLTIAFCSLTVFLQAQIFKEATKASNIDHVYKVYEGTFGGGAVVFDYNADGFEDVFLTGGMALDALYKNNKDGTFTNVYEYSGLGVSKNYVTQGAISADVNKDGWVDLFITTINTKNNPKEIPRAKNLLFINNGNGTFLDKTDDYGLADLNSFSTGACFGDFNADGYPDIYVGNYFKNFEGKLGIIKDATIVSANQTAEGYLLLNQEGKTFVNVYQEYGLNHKGFGFGGVFTDFDNDGDQDLIVNQDFGYKAVPNLLYENMYPKKTFKEVGKELGMDLKINAMGSAVGDIDNDGNLDYYMTNIKFNWLMYNEGSKGFKDRSKELGTYSFAISWGANFADFDNDGDVDLYVSNGDLNPNCVPMGNFFFVNQDGSFTDNSRISNTNDYGIGRGSVVLDVENDGDLDILVVNQEPILEYPVESKTRLFLNEGTDNDWIKFRLKGKDFESNGTGAKVYVTSDNKTMVREVDGGGSSHLSQNTSTLHFGLGKNSVIEAVKVVWPDGSTQVVQNPKVNQLNIIEENIPKKSTLNLWFIGALVCLLILILSILYNRTKS
ncbi:CRTAC1 family protein [Croceivirga radicis]|uniref:CRTAC1 family protein n=1 Tax=Croceivirga radicis TaxID=1929488 RepID=UPI000255ABFC|nr:CRTAC1 family protein [Croceivirga radicis]